MRQWDLTRAVPRHVRDVKLVKGDILGIATRRGFVYTCGADGSIRCAHMPPTSCAGLFCLVCNKHSSKQGTEAHASLRKSLVLMWSSTALCEEGTSGLGSVNLAGRTFRSTERCLALQGRLLAHWTCQWLFVSPTLAVRVMGRSMRRSWAIDKKGNLEECRAREKAHGDRVTALLAHNGFLYSVSYDGSIKMWDAESMELVMEERNAHDGGRINCATVGPDGNLYTGGDDKVPAHLLVAHGTLKLPPFSFNAIHCC